MTDARPRPNAGYTRPMQSIPEGTTSASPATDRTAAPDWLSLRREMDHRAREQAAPWVGHLGAWMRQSMQDHEHAVVIDLGAGTGSNQAYLAPRLHVPQRWVLLDHDPGVLQSLAVPRTPDVVSTEQVVGPVTSVPEMIRPGTPTLVTCSALLDVLTHQEAAVIAEAITSGGTAALLSLTVTGAVEMSPQDPDDDAVTAAFDAHQRRDGLLGPDGAAVMTRLLRSQGAPVEIVQTDWVLDHGHQELLTRYLTERAEAAVDHEPALSDRAEAWLDRRRRQMRSGSLTVRVAHQDLISIPGPVSGVSPR